MDSVRLAAAALLLMVGCTPAPSLGPAAPPPRPAAWAQALPTQHLKNCFRLDARVYRSGQPDQEGFAEAAALGVKSVLNLRDHHDDDSEAKGTGLVLYRVEMEAGDIKRDAVVRALRTLKAAQAHVLVHCWHGSDRTGLICALYRVLFQGWSREEALREMREGGYGHHEMFEGITTFLKTEDLEALRNDVMAP